MAPAKSPCKCPFLHGHISFSACRLEKIVFFSWSFHLVFASYLSIAWEKKLLYQPVVHWTSEVTPLSEVLAPFKNLWISALSWCFQTPLTPHNIVKFFLELSLGAASLCESSRTWAWLWHCSHINPQQSPCYLSWVRNLHFLWQNGFSTPCSLPQAVFSTILLIQSREKSKKLLQQICSAWNTPKDISDAECATE